MCMSAGWGGLDGQYVIGNMIGGKTGEAIKDASASSIMAKYGSEKKAPQQSVLRQDLQQTEDVASRRKSSIY